MNRFSYAATVAMMLAVCVSATADDQPSTTVETFDGGSRPANWGVNFGHWEVSEGVLVCRQLQKDDHAAASRWRVPLQDGRITARVQFAGAKQFHIGFDPAPKTLDKKGHLYSLIMTSESAMIKKHRDKAKQDSKDEILASAKFDSIAGNWTDVVLVASGNTVRAEIGGKVRLEATDPSFHVPKPAVVFRTVGGDLRVDQVTVQVTPATGR